MTSLVTVGRGGGRLQEEGRSSFTNTPAGCGIAAHGETDRESERPAPLRAGPLGG